MLAGIIIIPANGSKISPTAENNSTAIPPLILFLVVTKDV
jgi:hypothetical protein